MPRRFDKSPIMDQLKITAMAYGLKGMANMLNKPYSTLANELKEVDWAKPGLRDALSIVEISQDPDSPAQAKTAGMMMLDMIEEAFGRVAYKIPDINNQRMPKVMRLMSKLSKEFSEAVHCLADAIEDEKWTLDELQTCLLENQDLLKACLEINAFLQQLLHQKGGNHA